MSPLHTQYAEALKAGSMTRAQLAIALGCHESTTYLWIPATKPKPRTKLVKFTPGLWASWLVSHNHHMGRVKKPL